MTETRASVETSPLRAAASEEEYRLHQAALEWSVANPIIISSAEDIKSRANWHGKLKPYEHQVMNLMTFCRRLPVTLLADDVGLGKTISAGLILCELMVRNRVRRTLVICPSILGPQWIDEMETKFGIYGRFSQGAAFKDELRAHVPMVVTTYQTASKYMDDIQTGSFDMMILDEAHKVRNLYGTSKAPRMAQNIRKALQDRLFKYVLMLTATPMQNRLWDLYSLLDCLTVARGQKHPLGTPELFKNMFIADANGGARRLKLTKKEEFQAILGRYLVRTRREEAKLLFPKRVPRHLDSPPSEAEAELQQLVRRHIKGLNGLQQTSIAQALFSSPRALVAQLRNMSERDPRWRTVVDEAAKIADGNIRTAKFECLMKLIKELQREEPRNWRMVVFTLRKETQQLIGEGLKQEDIPFGFIMGAKPLENQDTIKAFRADPPEINVVVSTDAGAEGVNLQVSNVVVNFDLPWNPMIVEQRIGRVQRLGSRFAHVIVANLTVQGGIEERVVFRLMEKLQMISQCVGDIESILESATGDEDEEESFEAQIRDMVVKALMGQDVEKAELQKRKSIEDAKVLLEKQRQELDQTLGNLTNLHNAGPAMPELHETQPSLTPEEFVIRTMEHDGGKVEDGEPAIHRVVWANRPAEEFTFDEDAWREHTIGGPFLGKMPKLYKPGKPEFERLVQRWVDRAEHLVREFHVDQNQSLRGMAEQWARSISDAEVVDVEVVDTSPYFRGTVTCKATISNSVDSYEKLLDVHIGGADVENAMSLDSPQSLVEGDVNIEELCPDVRTVVSDAAHADPDVCKFAHFYVSRLSEELQGADGNASKTRIENDYRPHLHNDIVAVRGEYATRCVISVRFTIDHEGEYVTCLEGLPAIKKLISEPAMATCQVSHRRVPEECLATCSVSNKRVLKHLLFKSDHSGRLALHRFMGTCEISGKIALKDELAASVVSGKKAMPCFLVASAVSGSLALPGEMAKCGFSEAKVLPSEVFLSEVSGKPYRADQAARSALSETRGHRSEFVKCSISGQILLPSEVDRSQVSGRLIRKDLIELSEKPPHRLAAPDELVRCETSGKLLATDEVAESVVSGKKVDVDLLRKSDVSGRPALPNELCKCEVSGRILLPDEIGVCCITGKGVDRRILGESEVSGSLCLKELLVRCAATGKNALPEEVGTCTLTGRQVLLSVLEKCCVTGNVTTRDLMVQSQVSGKWILKDRAVKSILNGAVCAPAEAKFCLWREGPVLPSQSETCRLTRLTFSKDLLSNRKTLRIFAEMLSGLRPAEKYPELVPWLRDKGKQFKNMLDVAGTRSLHGSYLIGYTMTAQWLGLKQRLLTFVADISSNPTLLGHVAEWRWDNGRWIVVATHPLGDLTPPTRE